MKLKLGLFFVALSFLLNSISVAQDVTPATDSVTWQNNKSWHQHYDTSPLDVALPLVDKPMAYDPIPIRFTGIWINRSRFNLWKHIPNAFVAQFPSLIHGYIDESNIDNIPRFKFVGENWHTESQAKTAKEQIVKAFAEWSALQAGNSPITGRQLKTGLEFRLIEPTQKYPNPQAEIEFYWRPFGKDKAGNISCTIRRDGVIEISKIAFNSSNNWWFGTAATTPLNQMHFYSSALHELGHIIGLRDSKYPLSVMIDERNSGPNGPSFDAIDECTKRVVYALYSIPVTEAPYPVVTTSKDNYKLPPTVIYIVIGGTLGVILLAIKWKRKTSNQPSPSDSQYTKPAMQLGKKGKSGAKKGHKTSNTRVKASKYKRQKKD